MIQDAVRSDVGRRRFRRISAVDRRGATRDRKYTYAIDVEKLNTATATSAMLELHGPPTASAPTPTGVATNPTMTALTIEFMRVQACADGADELQLPTTLSDPYG